MKYCEYEWGFHVEHWCIVPVEEHKHEIHMCECRATTKGEE